MKKLSTYLFFIFLSFFINQNSFSKDLATWGPTGSDCKDLKPFLNTEEEEDGIKDMKTVSYTKLVPYLVDTIQVMDKRIKELEKKVE